MRPILLEILHPINRVKSPHMARCGTFLKVEPAIFPPPKTQQVVQSKTDFDELELDMEMYQALILTRIKPNKNQEI